MTKSICFALLSVVGAMSAATSVLANDFLSVVAHPDKVFIVDMDKRKIIKDFVVENSGATPIVSAVSPDAKYVYVLANGSQSVIKIDMSTGKNVLRLDMSQADERVWATWGMNLSPDGKTIAVYQNPVKHLRNEFKVQPTRIAFYDAETLKLKFTAPAPRQVSMVMYSTDGKKIFALGRNMYVFDAASGKQLDELPIQKWSQKEHFPPDALNVWYQYDNSQLMVAPYYVKLRNKAPASPETYQTGLMTLDLRKGELQMKDIEPTQTIYFSMAASPDHKRAYAVYNVLQSFDLENGGKPLKQLNLPHTFYSVVVSSDNKYVWIGGAGGDLLIYDAATLDKVGELKLPGNANMSNNSALRLFTVQ
ncbi:quinohemoprotein amine dehydrogenase subunit beta [Pseudomonas sp. MAFF 302030]|uniref:Quinohemoprotein amine dehydrogenase subunit beta n=1 Tax=Pseudomonas morbosilactucae TaxID=2938197 RepID=A0A9X1Z174_9PSED|nr:quinohemoprotein amine dehydrogenase subunit beta [Pseudomonas morbosilactucae]MCK9801386.1 quinohemoprotein amine dehydrogenase subunit beta [Pseudomonas morbosilactucae]